MDDRRIGEDTYKFNMAIETLMRLNKQLYAIWESKHNRNIFDLHKNLIILEQELSPFLKKLSNHDEQMNKLRDIKERTNKYLSRYGTILKQGDGTGNIQLNLAFSGLAEYDALLRDFMQDLKLLMVERHDPGMALLE